MADEDAATDLRLERLAAEQQFTLWHDLVQPLFRVRVEDEAMATFRAEVRGAPISDALLTACTSRAQSFERSMSDVRSSGSSSLSGLVSRTALRRGSSGASPNASCTPAR